MFGRRVPKLAATQAPRDIPLKEVLKRIPGLLFAGLIFVVSKAALDTYVFHTKTVRDYVEEVLDSDVIERSAAKITADIPATFGIPASRLDLAGFEAALARCARAEMVQWLSTGDPKLRLPVTMSDVQPLANRFFGGCLEKVASEGKP